MTRLRVVAFLVLLLSLLPSPAAQASTYRWPSERQTVCVERHLDRYWGVINAVIIWNDVNAGQPKFRLSDNCPYYGSVIISDVWRPNWGYGGMAWTTVSDGHILRAVIHLNNAAPAGLSRERARRWKRFASGHELGHALGLHHNETPGSIMCYCTDWYANDGSLNWADRQNLNALY